MPAQRGQLAATAVSASGVVLTPGERLDRGITGDAILLAKRLTFRSAVNVGNKDALFLAVLFGELQAGERRAENSILQA